MKSSKKIQKYPKSSHRIPQDKECNYSFWDLYKEVYGRDASDNEKSAFTALSQAEKNKKIKRWVEQVQWIYEDRIGADGATYTAFAPKGS